MRGSRKSTGQRCVSCDNNDNVVELDVNEFRNIRRVLNKSQLARLIVELAEQEAESGQTRKADSQDAS